MFERVEGGETVLLQTLVTLADVALSCTPDRLAKKPREEAEQHISELAQEGYELPHCSHAIFTTRVAQSKLQCHDLVAWLECFAFWRPRENTEEEWEYQSPKLALLVPSNDFAEEDDEECDEDDAEGSATAATANDDNEEDGIVKDTPSTKVASVLRTAYRSSTIGC